MNFKYNVWLTTLDRLRLHRTFQSGESTGDDDLLKVFIQQASMDVSGYLQRLPLPHVETRLYDYRTGVVINDQRTLLLSDDLLELTTLTNGDGSTTIASSSYTLQPGNDYPKRGVTITYAAYCNGTYFKPPTNGNTEQVFSVAGVWGYAPHYVTAWKDSGQDLGDILNSSDTSFSLTSTAAFEVGQYIRIDTEYLQVTANNTSSNTLTVERGALGSTAAEHASGSDVEQWQHLQDIQNATTEWAAYLYKLKDQIGEQLQVFQDSVITTNNLSPLVKLALRPHRRIEIGSV